MAPAWREVQLANEEKRCELVLSGPSICKRIEEDGLDTNIFHIKHLNFLEISKTSLKEIPSDIGELTNLTRIVFRSNELQSLPSSIGELKKLKFLDVSFNAITLVPDGLKDLTDLQSLNFSNNELTTLPNLSNLVNLVSLNIACNKFTEFPADLCVPALIHFSDFIANNNSITEIPGSINQLPALKVFNLSENALLAIPGELGDCTKLKELNLKSNKLKDNRLVKLIDQCPVKKVIEYIRVNCAKSVATDESKQAKSKKKSKQNKKNVTNEEIIQLLDQIKVLHVQDETIKVISMPNVSDVRPYIVCCIFENINLKKDNLLKQFITLQTKIHETVCEKRKLATIATHDLAKINGNLRYDARDPKVFKVVPLNRKNEVTAAHLYAQLNNEAEAIRKEKKTNTYSGIHKYLYLLKDKPLYPCLIDSGNQVVSFPPITNCEGTKVSEDTTNIFVEVTGNALADCKKVMDCLIQDVLKLGIGDLDTCGDGDSDTNHHLSIQQVKIVDEEGLLKVVYPSRTDIQSDRINVIRS